MASETEHARGTFFTGLLNDHARIEARLEALVRAAEGLSRVESDAEALAVVRGTLEFIATEGARHEACEELTLFPRLRGLHQFKQILSALELQHRMNEAAGLELSACVGRFAPGSGRELRRLAFRFVDMHRGHAFAEEKALFPLATSVLSPEVIAEMDREMLARNRVPGAAGEIGR